jgi:SAM-dependent methyltransferase
MDYRSNNPGSSQFGNFINYYNFHPPENRVNLFPEDIWEKGSTSDDSTASDLPFIVLDVGCNSGNLTLSIYQYLKQQIKRDIIILGIDIDPALIARANSNNEFANNIEYHELDIMKETNESTIQSFLKSHGRQRFDAVFCLSVTMWIHLNHGDNGLECFIQKVADLSQVLIIEPQPWKCYLTALKRMRKGGDDFPLFKDLIVRQTVETEIENSVKKKSFVKLYQSIPTKWNRTIYFYKYEDHLLLS